MLKTVYFDAHHRHKWQCFRIRLVDKLFNYQTENLSKVTIYYSKDESPDKLKQKLMQNIGIENYEKLFIKGKKSLEFVKYQVQD